MIQGIFRQVEIGMDRWARWYGVATLQISLGTVYVWFGALKLLGHDPTVPIQRVAFYDVNVTSLIKVLGAWELAMGVVLLLPLFALPRRFESLVVRTALVLFALQIFATIAVMLSFSMRLFAPSFPFVSVVGEFLVRNFVFAAAGLVIAAHLREVDSPGSAGKQS